MANKKKNNAVVTEVNPVSEIDTLKAARDECDVKLKELSAEWKRVQEQKKDFQAKIALAWTSRMEARKIEKADKAAAKIAKLQEQLAALGVNA